MARTKKDTGQGTPARGQADWPDLASLDALVAMAAGLKLGAPESDLDRAQDMAFDAMETPDRRKRIALAKEALAISPLCADAYLVLAREATQPDEALNLLRKAVEAGAAALGDAAFEDDAGLFWGLIETRPYMRARLELARALWEAGERDEAVGHYQDMLRLNPNDNQGVRYSLLDTLLELGHDREATELLKRYKEDESAAWAWSGALLAYRQKGDAARSRKAFSRAMKTNPHVPDYLLGRKPLPQDLPEFIGMGDQDEAIAYVHDANPAWVGADGAKAWLDACVANGSPTASKSADRKQSDNGVRAEAERIDQAVLALLVLGLHDGNRVWKTFDWDAMNRLHAEGLISNPASRAKSVVLTEKGLQAAKDLHRALFTEGPAPRS